MKIGKAILLLGLFAGILTSAPAQVFQNLGFESALVYTGTDGFGMANYSLPHWTISYNGVAQSGVWSNNYVLDSTTAALMTGSGALAGNRSLYLSASSYESPVNGFSVASLAQTGLVPGTANSIQFLLGGIDGFGPGVAVHFPEDYFFVTMNGQNVPLQELGTSGRDLILGGDISQWAGQTTDLSVGVKVPYSFPQENLFSGTIDSISFSAVVVPEPSTLALAVTGGMMVVMLYRRRTLPVR